MKLSKHYLGVQLYRLRIVGLLPFLKDVYRVEMRRRRQRAVSVPMHVIGDANANLRILYIHMGWSTYNVGLSWFSNLDGVQCCFVDLNEFFQNPDLSSQYDVVLFAYTDFQRQAEGLNLTKPIWVIVHDPMELYPQVSDWKALTPNPAMIDRLGRAARVFSVSREMKSHLERAGIESKVIPTSSILPARLAASIRKEPGSVKVCTVGRVYPRKNFELFKAIKATATRKYPGKFTFYAKWDYEPLPESKYIELLDANQIYIVTSFQEGGPIPAMDAMMRGEVVLSTPVGQMPEILENGYNGFLCSTLDEFVARLNELASDRDRLLEMRQNALQSIQTSRSRESILRAVQEAIRD